jgi:hypothetical protein
VATDFRGRRKAGTRISNLKNSGRERFKSRIPIQYFSRQFSPLCLSFESQVVTSAFDGHQLLVFAGISFNACSISAIEPKGSRVPCTKRLGYADEKMLGAKLLGLARRVQRIGKQEQAGSQISRSLVRIFFRKLGAEHAGLASAVGVAAEKDRPLALDS